MPSVYTRRAPAGLGLMFAAALIFALPVRAEPTVLRLAHAAPVKSYAHTLFLKPWAQRLPISSGGRLKVVIEAGSDPETLAARLRAGEVDLAWLPAALVLGPGAPALTLELPFLAWPAEAVGQAAMDLQRRHGGPVAPGIRLLLLNGDAPGVVHLRAAPLRRLEDLKGKRLSAASAALRAWLSGVGATPVAVPHGDRLPGMLERGELDGVVLSFAAAATLGVIERAPFHTEAGRPPRGDLGRTPGLGTVLYALAVNEASYAALRDDLRMVLDASVGRVLAERAGRTWDKIDHLRRRDATAEGQVFHTLRDSELRRWHRAAGPVIEDWIAAAEARGYDGRAILHEARLLAAKYYILMGEEPEARTKPPRGRGG